MSHITIGFLGGGNMTQSIVAGLVSQPNTEQTIWVADRHPEKNQRLANKFGINTTEEPLQLVEKVNVLVLSVKPQSLNEAIAPLKSLIINKAPLIISVAAGITTSSLETLLSDELRIIRTMPNTPALVNAGVTGLFANSKVTSADKQIANQMLASIGIIEWLANETDMDALTALSGSGPAYFFMIMEAMILAAENLGLDKELATRLTLQTAFGAAKLAQASELSLGELRQNVTSKGGVTAEGLKCLELGGINDLLKKTLDAARQRAQELGAIESS